MKRASPRDAATAASAHHGARPPLRVDLPCGGIRESVAARADANAFARTRPCPTTQTHLRANARDVSAHSHECAMRVGSDSSRATVRNGVDWRSCDEEKSRAVGFRDACTSRNSNGSNAPEIRARRKYVLQEAWAKPLEAKRTGDASARDGRAALIRPRRGGGAMGGLICYAVEKR